MADDISKNISIQITAETDKLEQSITNFNKIIDNLQKQQKQLAKSGKSTSAAFKDNADKIDIFQKSLQNASSQLNTFKTALSSAAGSLQQNKTLITALTSAKEKYSKAAGDNSKKVKELDSAIKTLSSSAKQHQTQIGQSSSAADKHSKSLSNIAKQAKGAGSALNSTSGALNKQAAAANSGRGATENHAKALSDTAKQAKSAKSGLSSVNGVLSSQKAAVEKSKSAFDLHKATMDQLKTSFDEVKGISGEFGPSLQDVATGFNAMKSGLDIMKGGIKGIGEAIEADGFGLLLQILQSLFDAFVKSSTGGKILQGVISAIGVVVNEVKTVVSALTDIFINAFNHPIDTIKALGKMIMENLINRFTAFSVILDGIMHLDFKKVANGAIQAVTGVANATDKIVKATKTVVSAVKETGEQIAASYKKGYNEAGKASDNFTKKLLANSQKEKKAALDAQKSMNNSSASANASQSGNTAIPLPKTERSDPDPDQVAKELNEQQQILDAEARQNQALQSKIKLQGTAIDNDKKTLENAKDITSKYDAQKQLISDTAQLEITKAQENSEAIKQIETQRNKDLITLYTQYQQQKAGLAKQKAQEIKDFELKMAQEAASTAFSLLSSSIKQQSDAKLAALQKDEAADLSNSTLTGAQKIAIQQKYKTQENQLKVKEFKDEQDASIAQAVINGALAVTKATSQTGVLSPLVVPEIIAETAIEIAKIASQKPPAYASGGLHYTSDGRGGLLPGYSRTDNTNAFLRSGEGIVVSEAMRDPWARNLVSAINVGFGGRDFSTAPTSKGFAVGGIFTDGGNANRYYNQPVTDNKNLANTIAYQMINNFPPVYVDVKDINNQQNILAQTINRVNL